MPAVRVQHRPPTPTGSSSRPEVPLGVTSHTVRMNGIAVVLVFALSWIIPIALVVYFFRTLGTIVEGLRSINAGVQRTAAAVEALAARTSDRT